MHACPTRHLLKVHILQGITYELPEDSLAEMQGLFDAQPNIDPAYVKQILQQVAEGLQS